MKKLLYMVALTLVAGACMNKVPVDFGEVEPKLVMNAQLESREGEQLIYLSESSQVSLKPVHGAEVTVYVDGKPLATASEVEAEDIPNKSPNAAAYSFLGGFPVGSQVKVSAKKGSWEAWAQADVLPPPSISAVDTLRTLEQEMAGDFEYTEEVFHVKISFKDLPGDNYYQVGVLAYKQVTLVDAMGETREKLYYENLSMSGSSDPVLGGAAAGMSIFDLGKTFLVFSDQMFRDQEYTLRLSVPAELLSSALLDWDGEFIPVYFLTTTTLVPWLECISREEYDYMSALNNLENFGYTSQVIVEPTTIPSNVNGGLGFLAVRSRTQAASMELPVVRTDLYFDPTFPQSEQNAGQ